MKISNDVEINDKIDIRTIDYVWTVGTIKMIIEQMNKEPLYVVHKEGFANEWDEIIYRNSPRVAKLGAYTSRNDIPSYVIDEKEQMDDPDPESTDY